VDEIRQIAPFLLLYMCLVVDALRLGLSSYLGSSVLNHAWLGAVWRASSLNIAPSQRLAKEDFISGSLL